MKFIDSNSNLKVWFYFDWVYDVMSCNICAVINQSIGYEWVNKI